MALVFCPECGGELHQIRDLRDFWAEAYRCERNELHAFLNVADMRWVYPLQPLQVGVAEAIEQAGAEALKLAFGRVKIIDYKTISIVFFEHTLLGCYDPEREYQVVAVSKRAT